jgi:uncharacterized protein (DUF2062 family)
MKRWIPTRDHLMQSRWFSLVAHHFHDDRLWQMERGSVARGVAVGLFIGLLLPLAQFLFAAVFAIWLRANVAVAAAATLVTNPLTFAPIYWLAHRIGSVLLGHPSAETRAEAEIVQAQTASAASDAGWLAAAWDVVQSAGPPLILGLAILAVTGALCGFALVWLLWRTRTRDARN